MMNHPAPIVAPSLAQLTKDVGIFRMAEDSMPSLKRFEAAMDKAEDKLILNEMEDVIADLKEQIVRLEQQVQYLESVDEDMVIINKGNLERIAALTTENKRLRDRLKSHGDIETDKEEIAQAALGKEENDE